MTLPARLPPEAYGPITQPGIPRVTKHALAVTVAVDEEIRCWRCKRLLAEMAGRPWRVRCARCKAVNESSPT